MKIAVRKSGYVIRDFEPTAQCVSKNGKYVQDRSTYVRDALRVFCADSSGRDRN